jgi:glycosyltransferase involved in cell wall biosynthesis
MESNLVSVIILTYNRALLLKESIESVLSQTYSNFELIIVDDGSTDETEQVIQEIKDFRIRYFRFDHCGHTSKWKNFAIKQAKGEYIAFNDSDDNWKPTKLEKQMNLFASCPDIGFSLTDVITFSKDAILIEHSYHSDKPSECASIFERLRDSKFLVYPFTIVMKRDCVERTGWFEESMISGDYHFILRLAYFFKVGILYEPLVWRRAHENNMSNQYPMENYEEFIATFELLYRNRWIDSKHLRTARSIAFYGMAQLLNKLGKPVEARRQFIRSIGERWYHVDSYIGLIKTFR